MPYYKDTENKIHFLNNTQYTYLLPPGSVEITDEEAEAIRQASQPSQSIPTAVTMRQARLALLQSGYLSTVNAAINAGGEADKITWEYASEVNRADPLVANMAVALNLSSTDLDNLFTLAASL